MANALFLLSPFVYLFFLLAAPFNIALAVLFWPLLPVYLFGVVATLPLHSHYTRLDGVCFAPRLVLFVLPWAVWGVTWGVLSLIPIVESVLTEAQLALLAWLAQ
ncbi:MAG: hypothetical protein AAGF84_04465 [Planctomycetota bacterium]